MYVLYDVCSMSCVYCMTYVLYALYDVCPVCLVWRLPYTMYDVQCTSDIWQVCMVGIVRCLLHASHAYNSISYVVLMYVVCRITPRIHPCRATRAVTSVTCYINFFFFAIYHTSYLFHHLSYADYVHVTKCCHFRNCRSNDKLHTLYCLRLYSGHNVL